MAEYPAPHPHLAEHGPVVPLYPMHQDVLRKCSAVVLSTSAVLYVGLPATNTVSGQASPAREITENFVRAENGYPESPEISYEASASVISDYAASSEHVSTYRYAGLEQLTFMRPTEETVDDIYEAHTLQQLEDAAQPFLASRGLTLRLADIRNYEKGYDFTPVKEENLHEAVYSVAQIVSGVADKPVEETDFANVREIVLTAGIPDAVGLAIFPPNNQPGAIAVNVHSESTEIDDILEHEWGHHMADSLEELTDEEFTLDYDGINPPGFKYDDELTEKEAQRTTRKERQKALGIPAVRTVFSLENIGEDEAEGYSTLYLEEETPDPGDASFGYPTGVKRVVWIEYLDHAVPGLKEYFLGRNQQVYPS